MALRTRIIGMLKSPGTPSRACVCREYWRYRYLPAFSGVDNGVPGIKTDWCIYSIQQFTRLPWSSLNDPDL